MVSFPSNTTMWLIWKMVYQYIDIFSIVIVKLYYHQKKCKSLWLQIQARDKFWGKFRNTAFHQTWFKSNELIPVS